MSKRNETGLVVRIKKGAKKVKAQADVAKMKIELFVIKHHQHIERVPEYYDLIEMFISLFH